MIAGRRGNQPGEVLNLCFHGIGTPGRELEPDEELYWVEEAQFEDFLQVIGRYPSVRITFDDGNASDAVLALPALRRHDLKATFFIISGRLDHPGSLASTEVRSLVQSGMTVGSHGMRHRPWRSVSDEELQEELVVATDAIADAAGRLCRRCLPIRLLRSTSASRPSPSRLLPRLHRRRRARAGATLGFSPATRSELMTRQRISSVGRARPRGTAFPAAVRTAQVVRQAMAVGVARQLQGRGTGLSDRFRRGLAAIETAWSLQGAGFKVVAFRRAG